MSLIGLLLADQVTRRSLELTAMLIPSVVLGIVTAHRIKHRLNAEVVRPAVLALCTLSATALLIRTIV